MSLFINASAIVAMVGREPEAASLARQVEQDGDRFSSAVAIWEASLALARIRGVALGEARTIVNDFVRTARIAIVPIGAAEAELALDAHRDFGKGRHPAALNMGDCFAYACTRSLNARILFKGEDFARTDLVDASLHDPHPPHP